MYKLLGLAIIMHVFDTSIVEHIEMKMVELLSMP